MIFKLEKNILTGLLGWLHVAFWYIKTISTEPLAKIFSCLKESLQQSLDLPLL